MRPALVIAAITLVFVTHVAAALEDAGRLVRVRTGAGADSVTVGERLRVVHEVSYPDSLVMLPLEKFDAGTCRVLAVEWKNRAEGMTRVSEGRFTIVTTDLEEAYLPQLPLHFLTPAGDTLRAFTGPVTVPVRHIAVGATEPRALKPQWQPPRSFAFLYWIGGALALAALLAWLWHRRRRTIVVAPPAPELPADFVALRALERIEAMTLAEAYHYKEYYTALTDTVRRYLEKRFGVEALDRTSDELLAGLAALGIHIDGLEPLLREADLVKFAKVVPAADDCRRSLQRARDVVVTTTPQAVAVGEGR